MRGRLADYALVDAITLTTHGGNVLATEFCEHSEHWPTNRMRDVIRVAAMNGPQVPGRWPAHVSLLRDPNES